MNYHIKLNIESEHVDDLLLDLLEIDGVEVQFEGAIEITDQELKEFEQSKRPYPYYSWDPKDVTIILITIPSIITSITGLAKVILDYKVKSEQNKSTRKKSFHQEPTLIIDGKAIPLSEF